MRDAAGGGRCARFEIEIDHRISDERSETKIRWRGPSRHASTLTNPGGRGGRRTRVHTSPSSRVSLGAAVATAAPLRPLRADEPAEELPPAPPPLLKCAHQLRSHPRRVGAVQPALPPERRAARGQPRVVHEQRRRRRRTAAQGRDRRVYRAIPARRLHAVRPDARPSRLADGLRRAVGPLRALPVDAVRLCHAAAGGARRDDRTERRERAKEWPLGRPSGRSTAVAASE